MEHERRVQKRELGNSLYKAKITAGWPVPGPNKRRKEMSNKFRIAMMMSLLLVCSSAGVFAMDLDQERQTVREKITRIDRQISAARAQGNTARVRQLQSEKKDVLDKWEAVQSASSDDVFIPVAQLKPEQSVANSSGDEEMGVQDVREEMNKAIAELKGQLDSVKKDNSDAKVGGTIRAQWTKGLDNNASVPYNSFDITRAYIDVRKRIGAGAQARITLDVDRISAAGASRNNLFDYIKYAYVDLPVDIPSSMQVIPFSLTAKFGLQHTCWIDWSGKIWRFENVRATFADAHKNSITSSADFGLGAAGAFTLPMMPEIQYHATLLNGAGYRSAETNGDKDVALRLNANVYSGDIGTVVLGGYIGERHSLFNTGNAKTTQSGLLVALTNSDYGNVYVEYQNDQRSNKPVNGYSIGGFIYPAKEIVPAGLLARYDMYNPDTTSANKETKTTVLGAFYDWGKDVTMSLDLTSSQTGTAAEQKVAALRSEIKF